MNRQDIIDKMNPHEKEVFEKYSNTILFPLFPIEDFIREIGIDIIVDDTIPAADITYKVINDVFSIIIHPELAANKSELREYLTIALMGYFFNEKASSINLKRALNSALLFLLSTEILESKIKELIRTIPTLGNELTKLLADFFKVSENFMKLRLVLLNEKNLKKAKSIGIA